jgi:glycosyltransferase involved in cell wall biosynthesis
VAASWRRVNRPEIRPYDPRMSPEVTIVIPTRNRWELLAATALPSALGQEEVDHEIVVVDEGSTDGTAAGLASIGDPRLRVVRHDQARGVAQARNAGIAAAGGTWVAFLDDDDVWSPEKLRRQLDAGAQASFVYSAAAWLDAHRRYQRTLPPPSADGLSLRLLRWNEIWAGGSNVIARTEVLTRLGGFDERLFQLADWDMWLRLALAGSAAAVNDVLVGYVQQPQSMLLTDRRDVFAEFRYLVEKHQDASARLGARPDSAKFARWVAFGHLRADRRRLAATTYLRAVRHGDAASALRAVAALGGERRFGLARGLRRGLGGADAPPAGSPLWLARYETG